MSIKNKELVKYDPDLKIKPEPNDDCNDNETRDEKDNEVKPTNTKPDVLVEESPIFLCTNCKMTERYDYFGDRLPINRIIGTKIDYYIRNDPFSPRHKKQFFILGSVCSICDKEFCVKPECSIFYGKFFCSICARKNITYFPPCIQDKIKTIHRV